MKTLLDALCTVHTITQPVPAIVYLTVCLTVFCADSYTQDRPDLPLAAIATREGPYLFAIEMSAVQLNAEIEADGTTEPCFLSASLCVSICSSYE